MLALIVSRNVGNYNFPKYWQLKISEMLATIFIEILETNVNKHFSKMATNVKSYNFQKYKQWIFSEISNYNFQMCRRCMLAIRIPRNAGDKC